MQLFNEAHVRRNKVLLSYAKVRYGSPLLGSTYRKITIHRVTSKVEVCNSLCGNVDFFISNILEAFLSINPRHSQQKFPTPTTDNKS